MNSNKVGQMVSTALKIAKMDRAKLASSMKVNHKVNFLSMTTWDNVGKEYTKMGPSSIHLHNILLRLIRN